jgi:5-methyltetrahydropteroyltriglutamate--homocysteine methyltransferase
VKDLVPGAPDIHERRRKARSEFLSDVSKNVIYPTLKSLHEKGAHYLQIDEPAATTKRDEVPEFLRSVSESVGDLQGKAFFVIHICFSNYHLLFPGMRDLEGVLDEVHLEYANRDSEELGTTSAKRFGYEILADLKNTSFTVGLGVLHIHTDFIEPPELVRDRILYAVDVIGDPSRIMVSPDCGLRTRTWEVTYAKLRNMVEGVHLAKKELGI